MPVVRFSQSVLAGATFIPNLSPYDRFGGNGGSMRVQATGPFGAAIGAFVESLYIGGELIEDQGPLTIERVLNNGPDAFTPSVGGPGAPADAIALRYRNTTAGALIVAGIVQIDNL
jgi:hypothetical protein